MTNPEDLRWRLRPTTASRAPYARGASGRSFAVVGGEIVPADTDGAVAWTIETGPGLGRDPIDDVAGQTRYDLLPFLTEPGACSWAADDDGVLHSTLPMVRVAGPYEVHETVDGSFQLGCAGCGWAGVVRRRRARRLLRGDAARHRCPPPRPPR